MPARHFIFALYLFILAMLSQLLFPVDAHAVNWNSQETPPPVTTDAATADFWQACESIGVTSTAPDTIAYFDWYSIEHPSQTGIVPFCVVATVSPQSDDTTAQPLTLAIRFYRGTPGAIDADFILAMIANR